VSITVRVNGEERSLADGSTLGALLTELKLGINWVVVERNGEPVPRAEQAATVLADGDRLEIVRAVAGGA
jgi:sulfur carrier protein